MIIEFLLATTLNMSLPEFQPQEDISGNVIVTKIDDVSGEFIAEEYPLEEIPIESTSDFPLLGLSQEECPTEEFNEEEFILRSNGYLPTYIFANHGFTTSVNEPFINDNSSLSIRYVILESGYTYTFESDAPRVFYTYALQTNSRIYEVSSPITVNQTTYLCVRSERYLNVTLVNDEPGGDVSGDSPGGDVSGDSPGGDVSGSDNGNVSIDLTRVESKLDNVIVLQRSILMTLLVTFLFPIIKSCVNLLKGGKDV